MAVDINDERSVRLQRLQELQGEGIFAYPSQANRTHTIEQLTATFVDGGEAVTIVGRLRGVRRHGGSTFLDVEDGSGRFQVFCSKADLETLYEQLIARLDLGDHVQVTGKPFRTKAGSPALHASAVTLLSKALRPLPEQFHGLTDTELRYRRRELDLIANPEARAVARTRSAILQTLRSYLDDAGFLEVETPVLQSVPSGASAKPFVTHHNTLHEDLYLRVAPELYLKRLIVGGLEKVYEVARCFRNEGMDPQHNPEFTQIEFYAAYWDYQQMLDFCQNMLVHTVEKVHGKLVLEFDGKAVDFTPPFAKASYVELLQERCGVNVLDASQKDVISAIEKAGGDADPKAGRGALIDTLWKVAVRPTIQRPTFITDYPAELSPLAKRSAKDPRVVEMFQLVIAGSELIKAFTELNDPVDQRTRFAEQEALRKKGDDEAQFTDDVFVESLEYGMPPTAGAGLGIDRLTSILTGSHSIKEVILFPALRKN